MSGQPVPGPEGDAATEEPVETDVDADPTDEREEGPSPDEPTPTGDDAEDPEVDDDYDEEDHVEEVTDDRPEEVKVGEAEADGTADADKTWNQYKTEDERKKALLHNKRYGTEMAAKNRQLEAELASLKTGKPAAEPAPAPTTETTPPVDPKEARKKLAAKHYEENPNVKAHIHKLAKLRETTLAKDEEHKKLKTEREAIEATLQRKGVILDNYKDDLKADPDNYDELQQKISRIENEIEKHERDVTRKMLAGDRAERELNAIQAEYSAGSTELTDFLTSQERAISEKAKKDERDAIEAKAVEADWTKSFPDVMAELKVDSSQHKGIEEQLYESMDSLLNRVDKVPNLRAWMVEATKRILTRYDSAAEAKVKSYVNLKKKDANQPAPRGDAAVARSDKKNGARYDSRQANKDALASLTRRPSAR